MSAKLPDEIPGLTQGKYSWPSKTRKGKHKVTNIELWLSYTHGLAWAYCICLDKVPNYKLDTKLTAKEATCANTPAKSMSLRPECNGRFPVPGFGPKALKHVNQCFACPSKPGSMFIPKVL